MKKIIFITIVLVIFFASCKQNENNLTQNDQNSTKEVELTSDLSKLSANEKQMIILFIKASEYIDSMFFYENIENYQQILDTIKNEDLRKKFIFNFGPWDRFDNNKPFITGVGEKPKGCNFYPTDMKSIEFYEIQDDCRESNYTFIRRDNNGKLYCLPYHLQFKRFVDSISILLNQAAELSEDEEFANYLRQRAIDLQTDNYYKSDSIWVKLTNSKLDFIIGPTYVLDDKLFNLKAEHQSYILIKDLEWSDKMEKYNKWLRFLQKAIPVPEEYRAEEPGTNSSINVFDIIYFGGSGKSGGTLLSVVFPLDTKIQLEQGVRNLQFKNIIEDKFIVVAQPIANVLLEEDQSKIVSSEGFFVNTILYEMANSLGIRTTVNNKGSVRKALKDQYIYSDYIKNYALSLFLAEKLYEVGEIKTDLKDNYYTFVVDLVRLIRLGTENDYSISNLVIFNFLVENSAITFNKKGTINIDYEKMKIAIADLTSKIIIMQGNGDYEGMKEFINNRKIIDKNLQNTLNLVNSQNIPKDMHLIQGRDVLKL